AAVATLWLILWLPRSAHAAFETARYKTAARRYRVIGSLAFTAARDRASQLSRAACHLANNRPADAEPLLTAIDPAQLDNAERVVWLNNRACVVLDGGGDATAALALVEEATLLRPDVPAIQHTRARALIAIDRLDDAIAVLEALRAGGELPLRLEAERCRELAAAWERKGQRDYAADYRDRARLHAI
ncbi:MAG: tetratricopeptide repeat protein, partial [Kofleriaceae bacterium]